MRVSSTVDVDESRWTAVVVGILVSFSTRIPFYTEAQATTLHPTRSRGSIRGDFKDVIQLERTKFDDYYIIHGTNSHFIRNQEPPPLLFPAWRGRNFTAQRSANIWVANGYELRAVVGGNHICGIWGWWWPWVVAVTVSRKSTIGAIIIGIFDRIKVENYFHLLCDNGCALQKYSGRAGQQAAVPRQARA